MILIISRSASSAAACRIVEPDLFTDVFDPFPEQQLKKFMTVVKDAFEQWCIVIIAATVHVCAMLK